VKRTLIALAAGLGLTLFAVAAAFAWQSRIEGRPASFDAGGTSGVYFWHEDPVGLRLRTTDPENREHYFSGTITTDGTIRNLSLIRAEQDDTATVDASGKQLTFNFHTFSGIDGMDYDIQGGTYQTVNLQRDGLQLSIDRIFLGEDSVHPDHNPLTICRTGDRCY
jgi:hypothetical protein